MAKPELYIVCCIDTEGPANYALNDWDEIDAQMLSIVSNDFRFRYPDSAGRGLKLSFFIMDWTGFVENPVNRCLGYNKIYSHYRDSIFTSLASENYCLGWHYHHPGKEGRWQNGGWNRNWNDNCEYENQINHMIIDRKFFPSLYRAGGTIESNEQSLWLEKWIPFDFSSRAPEPSLMFYLRNIKSITRGRFRLPLWDWSKAPVDCGFYHPEMCDYQRNGGMKRSIFRCLDVNSGAYKITLKDIRQAFKGAQAKGKFTFSFFTHDYFRSAKDEIAAVIEMINKVSVDFNDVAIFYETANIAAKKMLFNKYLFKPPQFFISKKGSNFLIHSDQRLFSACPWIAYKDNNGFYGKLEAQANSELIWEIKTERLNDLQTIGVAASNEQGDVSIKIFDQKNLG